MRLFEEYYERHKIISPTVMHGKKHSFFALQDTYKINNYYVVTVNWHQKDSFRLGTYVFKVFKYNESLCRDSSSSITRQDYHFPSCVMENIHSMAVEWDAYEEKFTSLLKDFNIKIISKVDDHKLFCWDGFVYTHQPLCNYLLDDDLFYKTLDFESDSVNRLKSIKEIEQRLDKNLMNFYMTWNKKLQQFRSGYVNDKFVNLLLGK